MPARTASAIAERYDPFGGHLEDPYSFYAQARVEEPVFYSPTFQAWVVTRYADVRHILMHPKVFSSANAIRPLTASLTDECLAELKRGYLPAPSLVNTDGPAHQRLRAPFAAALTLKSVRRLEPFIRTQVEELVDAMQPDGKAEFMQQFAHPLLFRIHAHILGVPDADYEIMRDSNTSSRLLRGNHLPAEQVTLARQTVRFHRLMLDYAKARRAEPGDDLISAVMAELAPGDAPLTHEQEAELVWSLGGIVGSANSAASMLGTGLYHLLAEPERWDALVTRRQLIGTAIEEILRYDAPAQTFARITTEPVTIGDVDLPAGAEIMVMLGSANRDDSLVERPAEFDIARPRMRHLTFGQGTHVCVGATVVRAELRICLDTLTRRLPGLRLAAGRRVRMAPVLNHRQPLALHLTW